MLVGSMRSCTCSETMSVSTSELVCSALPVGLLSGHDHPSIRSLLAVAGDALDRLQQRVERAGEFHLLGPPGRPTPECDLTRA